MNHFHHCPHCYEAWECTAGCTIEPDLEDRGRPFASHWRCPHKLVCLIEAAAERHDRQLRSNEALKRITLARLQSPPRVVGVSDRMHDPRWDTVEIERRPPPLHRYDSWTKAIDVVQPGGVLVLLGGTHRMPTGNFDMKGVSIVGTHGADIDVTGGHFKTEVVVPSRPRRARHQHASARSKIRPHGVR